MVYSEIKSNFSLRMQFIQRVYFVNILKQKNALTFWYLKTLYFLAKHSYLSFQFKKYLIGS